MEDEKIIEMFWNRSEQAVDAVNAKYGNLCRSIAVNLLRDREDAEECVNDTWHALWQTIPPNRPQKLTPFIARITRNLAMKRLTYHNATKRAVVTVSFEELSECIPGYAKAEQAIEQKELTQALEVFLKQLEPDRRNMFLRRYWFFDPIGDIAKGYGLSAGAVKMRLHRIRKELKRFLEEEAQIYVG